MNERFKELLEQADIPHFPILGSLAWVATDHDMKKFAQSIVAECILTIQMGITRDGYDTEKYQRSMKHIKQIREHFGVER